MPLRTHASHVFTFLICYDVDQFNFEDHPNIQNSISFLAMYLAWADVTFEDVGVTSSDSFVFSFPQVLVIGTASWPHQPS
jgi:hypothetical protein